jgi:hypothetical protein
VDGLTTADRLLKLMMIVIMVCTEPRADKTSPQRGDRHPQVGDERGVVGVRWRDLSTGQGRV